MGFKIGYDRNNKSHFIQQNIHFRLKEHIIRVKNALSPDGVYEISFVEDNIVQYFVPISGIYKLEAWGATGGSSSTSTGAKGAYSRSYVYLKENEKIEILVGEKGGPGYPDNDLDQYCGGGAGGTFIAKGKEPLCVAGGGGSFTQYAYSSVQSHACGQSTQLGGNPPGSTQGELRKGGKGKSFGSNGAGGAGFEENGEDGNSEGKGGISFLNGGSRQTGGTYTTNVGYGGFGCGGSRSGNCGYPAGGGGYSGGSAAPSSNWASVQGGGGGSYFEGTYEEIHHLRFQDVILVCRIIQAQKEMATQ